MIEQKSFRIHELADLDLVVDELDKAFEAGWQYVSHFGVGRGAVVDINISTEWWAGAAKDYRKAMFVATIEVLGRTGMQVIPEEFAGQQLDPPEMPPSPAELDELLAAQVAALLVLVREGGDVRTANLDDRLFIDRLQDTLDARAKR